MVKKISLKNKKKSSSTKASLFKSDTRSKLPILAKAISIIGIILSLLLIVVSVTAFIHGIYFNEVYPGFEIGLFLIIPGIIGFILSKGLYNRKNWARIILASLLFLVAIQNILFLILESSISALNNFISLIVLIIIEISVALYLLLNKYVKQSFI